MLLRLEILIRRQQRLPSGISSSGHRGKANVTPALCGPAFRYQTLLQKARAISPPTLTLNDSAPVGQNTESTSEITQRPKALAFSNLDASGRGCPDTVLQCPPEPKLPHPKERVHLRHASLPKKSMIPVPVRARRLVELKHWSPSKHTRTELQAVSEPLRRKSSVKDLIRCFEGLGNRDQC